MSMSADPKNELRKKMQARRHALSPDERQHAAVAVIDHMVGMGGRNRQPIAVYHPLDSEFDPSPLVDYMRTQSQQLALPVVVNEGAALAFRPWHANDQLETGAFDILVPPDRGLSIVPELLIIPLLAFDDKGARLGYGGGFYDRTLASLRANHAISAIGLAYDFQQADHLPVEAHDQPLDFVLTPTGLRKF